MRSYFAIGTSCSVRLVVQIYHEGSVTHTSLSVHKCFPRVSALTLKTYIAVTVIVNINSPHVPMHDIANESSTRKLNMSKLYVLRALL
jgi:hypothetical protein